MKDVLFMPIACAVDRGLTRSLVILGAGPPAFSLLSRFYNQFGGKLFVLSEWGASSDEPGFVHELYAWVASHARVRMINFYQRFLAYPPKYAHPRRHKQQTLNLGNRRCRSYPLHRSLSPCSTC
jgi:hypothetical protein